jgi:ATP-dependent Lon protease
MEEIQKTLRMEVKPKEASKPKKTIASMSSWSDFNSTDEIAVPEKLVDQVIGQEKAVEIIRKAAKQRRNVLLIGEPGTGKSMLANAMTELLSPSELVDILAYPNFEDENNPKIRTVPAGEGIKIVKSGRERENLEEKAKKPNTGLIIGLFIILPALLYFGLVLSKLYFSSVSSAPDIIDKISIDPTIFIMVMGIGILFLFFSSLNMRGMMLGGMKSNVPKLIVDNSSKKSAPFFDGTGAHAGALLGDVKHDPLQSGGLGTPAHLRVVPGLIHKTNNGVLFIDEIGTLGKSQQDLLTALQERQLAITGRSEMSSGAMVMTDPVPCNFILVAAGNYNVVEHMHPALRSRIRGYGYEVYMDDLMEDTEENRKKIVQFVAQEVVRDGKIPHFTKDAVEEIINESRRKAGMKNKLTLKLRELGGLVRASGDIAYEKGDKYVTRDKVLEGKISARSLERQMSDVYTSRRKEYNVLITEGHKVGRVNGLAVRGEGGIVLPIEAEVVTGGEKSAIIATGKLGDIAKEAIQNVSAVIMKIYGEDIKEKYDIFVQFLQTYEGVEGDSASVSVAVAVLSALKNISVDQSVAMTGSLTVRGEVLPVGGIIPKIEAAAEAGLRKVIIPKSNRDDVLLEEKYRGKIEIVTAETLTDVLEHSFIGGREIIEKMRLLTAAVA